MMVARGPAAAVAATVVILAMTSSKAVKGATLSYKECEQLGGLRTFELVTGYSYAGAPGDVIRSIADAMQLADCIYQCSTNEHCMSINFETGLCILLNSSAPYPVVMDNRPSLKMSQFPVFTIYAEKTCILGQQSSRSCSGRIWAFERVIGFQLSSKFTRRRFQANSPSECVSACLAASDFECRSAVFERSSAMCSLSDMDRQSVSSSSARTSYERRSQSMSALLRDPNFGQAEQTATLDYFENNCVEDPKECEFRPIKGLILKTVDSVHENVHTIEECKAKCLDAPYRCFSFDFGADSEPSIGGICRTSHLNTGTVMSIEQPFVEMPGAVTHQLVSCLNVSVVCNAHDMVAKVRTNRIFNGKIYSRSRPNSCVNDVTNRLDFEIALPYNDLMCDVRHDDPERFTTDIVIQHHDRIVTHADLGLSVLCRFNLTNRTIVNVPLGVEGTYNEPSGPDGVIQATTVHSPNVTMRIADMDGNPVQTAHVGDPLTLIFEITDHQSPYEIFVRELVAVDGADSSEMVLIDSSGCPTDLTIMSPVSKLGKSSSSAKRLKVTFEAFKFPASNIVQFRALITPCLSSCKPVQCRLSSAESGPSHELVSYGRRKRRASTMATIYAEVTSPLPLQLPGLDEEVVVVGTIKITDAFNFMDSGSELQSARARAGRGHEHQDRKRRPGTPGHGDRTFLVRNAACTDLVGLIVACCVFLFAQLVLIGTWAYMWQRVRRHRELVASHQMAMRGHPASSLSHMYGSVFGHPALSSMEHLAPPSVAPYAQSHKFNEMMAQANSSFYEM